MSRPVIEIEGFKELQEKIRLLANPRDKKKEILLILRQVAKPTIQAAKSFINNSKKPHTARGKLINPGNLKKSIGAITGKQENPTVYVGPRAKNSFDGWYGHFVHDGHDIFNQRSSSFTRDAKGKFRINKVTGTLTAKKAKRRGITSQGRTKANPFMQKANQATNGQVTADAERGVTAFIQRRIDKLS